LEHYYTVLACDNSAIFNIDSLRNWSVTTLHVIVYLLNLKDVIRTIYILFLKTYIFIYNFVVDFFNRCKCLDCLNSM